jgi:dimethylargininase
VTEVAEHTLLVNNAWLADASPFSGYRIIEVDLEEVHAANAVRVGDTILYPDCFPKTLARLRAQGINVTTVDVSELQKAEGAMTCCSLLFRNPGSA